VFYQFWIVYATLGLLAAAAIFIWAVKSGQFAEQDRARFIPLRDDPIFADKPENSPLNPVVVGLAVVLFIGLCIIGMVLIVSIRWMG
jgi:nitrogen fixation-related uncharacterized protein